MAKQDARRLDHATLEAIRVRAVQQVRSGESPEVVIRALGFSRRCIYSWLAMYRKPLRRTYQQDGSRVGQWLKRQRAGSGAL